MNEKLIFLTELKERWILQNSSSETIPEINWRFYDDTQSSHPNAANIPVERSSLKLLKASSRRCSSPLESINRLRVLNFSTSIFFLYESMKVAKKIRGNTWPGRLLDFFRVYRGCRISPGSCKIKKGKKKKKKERNQSQLSCSHCCPGFVLYYESGAKFWRVFVAGTSRKRSWSRAFRFEKKFRENLSRKYVLQPVVLLMRYLRNRAFETYEYVSNFYSVRIR